MSNNRTEKEVHYLDAREFWAENKHLSVDTCGECRGYTSGRFRETHQLNDGRIVELWENNSGFMGMLWWCIEWASYEDWQNHVHTPRNIRLEVGL